MTVLTNEPRSVRCLIVQVLIATTHFAESQENSFLRKGGAGPDLP